jgi:RNA recognition motif-containing protein
MSAEQQSKTDQVPAAASPEATNSVSIVDEYPHKVFVGNIAFTTTEEQLREFFAPAGTV